MAIITTYPHHHLVLGLSFLLTPIITWFEGYHYYLPPSSPGLRAIISTYIHHHMVWRLSLLLTSIITWFECYHYCLPPWSPGLRAIITSYLNHRLIWKLSFLLTSIITWFEGYHLYLPLSSLGLKAIISPNLSSPGLRAIIPTYPCHHLVWGLSLLFTPIITWFEGYHYYLPLSSPGLRASIAVYPHHRLVWGLSFILTPIMLCVLPDRVMPKLLTLTIFIFLWKLFDPFFFYYYSPVSLLSLLLSPLNSF